MLSMRYKFLKRNSIQLLVLFNSYWLAIVCACYIGLYAPPNKQNILYNICRPTMLHKCQSCTNVIQMFCVHWAGMKHLFYTKTRFISNSTRWAAYCVKIFFFRLFQRYILLDYKKSNVHIQDLQYYGLSCLSYSTHEKVTLRPCCCDTYVRYIYWYRITCLSYMKLGFPTFYGAK